MRFITSVLALLLAATAHAGSVTVNNGCSKPLFYATSQSEDDDPKTPEVVDIIEPGKIGTLGGSDEPDELQMRTAVSTDLSAFADLEELAWDNMAQVSFAVPEDEIDGEIKLQYAFRRGDDTDLTDARVMVVAANVTFGLRPAVLFFEAGEEAEEEWEYVGSGSDVQYVFMGC